MSLNELATTQNGAQSELRGKIIQLERVMNSMPDRQVQIKTTHRFAPDVYIRELFIPKNTTLVGKIQKTEYLNVISSGLISVMTEDGLKKVGAPTVIRSFPGLKRAGYAHEDTVWITVHANPANERDIDKLEEMLFSETFDGVPQSGSRQPDPDVITWQGRSKDGYLSSKRTIEDVLFHTGTTADEMKSVSENASDQILFPWPVSVEIKESPIHGKGVFSACGFKRGEVIAPARVQGMRTPAGRYCNHAADPNAEMITIENGSVYLVASKDIGDGEEITTDYYLTFASAQTIGGAIPCPA